MSWKFWKRILLIMLGAWMILGVLVIGLLLVERVRGKISLAHYKRELNAAGIRLSPAQFLTNFPKTQSQPQTRLRRCGCCRQGERLFVFAKIFGRMIRTPTAGMKWPTNSST